MKIEKQWRGKNWTATFGNYDMVTAPTKNEARELAISTMEQMVSGSYRPRVLIYGNQTAVIWREPQGLCYSISESDADGVVEFGCSCHTGETDINVIERNVRQDMAQRATNVADPASDHSAFIVNDEDREEYRRWLTWQRAVRAALDAGMDMEAAREAGDRARYAA